MSISLCLALLSGTPLLSVSEVVDETIGLVRKTAGTSVDLAMVIDSEASLGGLEGLLDGLLMQRLEDRTNAKESLSRLDPKGGALEARARDAGAEWLLRVFLRPESTRSFTLESQLVRVDRGFWWRNFEPRVAASELYRIRIDDSVRAWLEIPSPKTSGPGLSDPQPWLALDEPVLDLAGCDLDPKTAGDELLVLTRSHLRAYRIAGHTLTSWFTRALDGPVAAPRLRVPRGRVICVPGARSAARVLIGTSDYASGAKLRLDEARATLVEEARLPGIPLLARGAREIELGLPDPDSGGFRLSQSGLVVLDLVAPGDRAFALVAPGRFTPLETAHEASSSIALGGLGGSARSELEPSWVTTSSVAWRGPDHLTLRAGDGRPIGRSVPIPGPVRASGMLVGPEGEVFVVAAVGQALAAESTLFRLSLGAEGSARP